MSVFHAVPQELIHCDFLLGKCHQGTVTKGNVIPQCVTETVQAVSQQAVGIISERGHDEWLCT